MHHGAEEVNVKPFKYIACSFFLSILLIGNTALADMENLPEEAHIKRESEISFGYQSYSVRNQPNRAAEYSSLKSSPTFGLKFADYMDGLNLHFNANYLNDEDIHATGALNNSGLLRLDFTVDRFFHNLDHIPYDNGYTGTPAGTPETRTLAGPPAAGSRDDGVFNGDYRAYFSDHNPDDIYGLRIDIDQIKMRAKLPSYPAHLNLAYKRIEKQGSRQLRFLDESCTGCHMQSRTRAIDRVTEEFKAGVDTHLGYVDLAAEVVHREFTDHENIPTDTFGSHFRGRTEGEYEHSEDPESEVTELTLHANTSPSGGLVGSASFTLGERKSKSDLTSVGPIIAKTDYYKASADATYTPSKFWTFNLRYRLLDIDNDNSDIITAYAGGDTSLDVRDSIDFQRAWHEAIVNYRPSNSLTIKAELRREDIDRENTGSTQAHHSTATDVFIDPVWELPSREIITRAKIGFHKRLLEKSALKLSGWAMLKHSDHPAYGTSYSDSREMFISANYAKSPFWGLATSLDLLDENNDDRTSIQLFDDDGDETTPGLKVPYNLERDRQQQQFSAGGWLIPANGLSLDINYGFLRTAINQDLLFGAEPNTLIVDENYTIRDDDVDYRQTVHTITAGATWQATEDLSCRVEGYHIRSKASFGPDFSLPSGFTFANGATATSSELKEISEIDIRQNGVKGRVNWQIDENWASSLTASYDKYDDKNSNIFDGSVNTYMASISRIW